MSFIAKDIQFLCVRDLLIISECSRYIIFPTDQDVSEFNMHTAEPLKLEF